MKPGSERCTEYGSTPEINQWNPKGTPVFFAFRNQRFLESKGDACLLKGHVRQNMTYAYHCIPMLWQHTESSPMSPPRVAISGKITLSISFENFNFLLLNAFVQTQTMTAPFSPPPAVLLAPGVYFRQQNSDDSKSLRLLLFCGPCAESATRFLLVSWCHRCHHWFFVGEKNQRFGFRVLFLSRNWGLESHIFVARQVEEQEDEGAEIYSM